MQGFLNAVTGIANESGLVGIMENPGYLIMIDVYKRQGRWSPE